MQHPIKTASLVLLAALSGSAVASASSEPSAPTPSHASTAKIIVTTPVYAGPGGGHVIARLGTQATIYRGANVLLVLDSAMRDGRRWLKVELPTRPNETSGWIPADNAIVGSTPYRVIINVSRHTLTLTKNGHRVLSTRAVVGAHRTPTPTGLYAISEVVPQPRGSKLGSYVLALTAHSNVHKTFDGGDGRIGLHGYEKLGAPLGTANSNGCIRLPMRVVRKLVKFARPGTPVEITG